MMVLLLLLCREEVNTWSTRATAYHLTPPKCCEAPLALKIHTLKVMALGVLEAQGA